MNKCAVVLLCCCVALLCVALLCVAFPHDHPSSALTNALLRLKSLERHCDDDRLAMQHAIAELRSTIDAQHLHIATLRSLLDAATMTISTLQTTAAEQENTIQDLAERLDECRRSAPEYPDEDWNADAGSSVGDGDSGASLGEVCEKADWAGFAAHTGPNGASAFACQHEGLPGREGAHSRSGPQVCSDQSITTEDPPRPGQLVALQERRFQPRPRRYYHPNPDGRRAPMWESMGPMLEVRPPCPWWMRSQDSPGTEHHHTHTHTRGRSGSRLRRNEGSSGNLKIREFSTNDGSDHRCRSLNGAGAYAAVRRSCNLRPGLRARLMARKHKWAKCPWAKTPTGSHVMRSRDAKNHDS